MYNQPPDLPEPPLHPDVAAHFVRAREAYLARDYPRCRDLNERAHTAAEQRGDHRGAVRARRFLALCDYREGKDQAAEQRFQEALAGAHALGWKAEGLRITDHLANVLRRTSKLGEAERRLREALEDVRDIKLRARLLASYGALLDDLGDREGAAEQYARAHELQGLFPDSPAFGNTLGLLTRALRLRGDLERAIALAKKEEGFGFDRADPHRRAYGALHLAQAWLAQATLSDSSDRDRLLDEVKEALERARATLAEHPEPRLELLVQRADAELHREMGDLQTAARLVLTCPGTLGRAVKFSADFQARFAEEEATLAARCGLHGLALERLLYAVHLQQGRLQTLTQEDLLHRARSRVAGLQSLWGRLQHERGEVARDDETQKQIETSLSRLHGFVLQAHVPKERTPEAVDVWSQRIRLESEERWSALLGQGFPALSPASREDLRLADVFNHGPVSDLSRATLLLLMVVERELWANVQNDPEVLKALKWIKYAGTEQPPPTLGQLLDGKHRSHLVRALEGYHSPRPGVVEAALDELDPSSTSNSSSPPLSLRQVRNRLAHGNDHIRNRLEADGYRFRLTIGETAPLVVLSQIASYRKDKA